ncbi:hypothetical protein GUJ93_ZPchr0008g11522 [Zizania palustris]|uniref:Uncharacterized protein n=1 Tax=Zizania palustris TaxID=103762 RepID=A0A8J5VHQ8_ZIZPA|nr:hypothetical protein GUJ93_ZPchr0008g11522 [Zizania palustris]
MSPPDPSLSVTKGKQAEATCDMRVQRKTIGYFRCGWWDESGGHRGWGTPGRQRGPGGDAVRQCDGDAMRWRWRDAC